MGQFLRTRWGKAYLNVGFAFDHGDFRSGDRQDSDRVHPFTVGPLPPGSFDATLNATGLPRFILDLRTPPAGVVTDWLSAQHGKREVTESFNPKWPWKMYSIELAVPANAAVLAIGGALLGDGAACFDDFRLAVIAPPASG